MERKIAKYIAVFAVIAIAISAIPVFMQGQNGPVYKDIDASISSLLGSNPVTTEMNFTFSRVAYTNQPPQMMWSSVAGYPSESFVLQSGEWLLNNSGYQIMNFNSSSSSVALATYSVASYLGANVSYFYNDQRIAFNGSSTSYIYIGETALTGAPTAANSLASSAGPAQNNVYLEITYSSSTGLYSMTLYYYAQVTGGNSQKYDNQTSVALTGSLQPLNFYDFVFNIVPSTGMQVTIENYTGAIINQTTITTSDLTHNISKIAYVQYGLTGTGALINDYGYIIDHNTYSYPAAAPLAGAFAPEQGIQANVGFNEVDPGTTSASPTQSMNSSSIMNVNISEDSFSSVVNSSSSESMTSSLINTTQIVNSSSSLTEASANNTITTLRATSGNPSISGTGTIYITSWTSSSIQSQLMSFLQSYISAQTGYPAADITIISYLITDIGFNMNFSSQAMTSIQNYIDSMVPGMLQANNLSLVNTTTGAIMAGAAAGDFYDFYMDAPVSPVMTSEGILNPATGITYSDLALAGFPAGSYISGGSIVVPGNVKFYGFTASGIPILGAGWNPFAGLSAAGKAVENFFHSAGKDIVNAITSVGKKVDTAVIKPVSGGLVGDVKNFANDVSKAVSHAFPVIGGAVGNIWGDIKGTLTKVASGISSGLGSFRNGVIGAVLTGVNDIKNTVYHIGSTIKNGLVTIPDAIWNTLGKLKSDAGAVLSPLFAGIKNLGGSILSHIKSGAANIAGAISGALGDARNILDSVGTHIMQGLSGAWNAVQNAFGSIGQSIVNDVGNLLKSFVNDIAHVVFEMLSSILGKIVKYVAIAAGIIIVIILAMFLTGHLGSKAKKNRGRKSHRVRTQIPTMQVKAYGRSDPYRWI
ncbi:MAG: hypothetical protein QW292_13780 [Candidatus Parvarchaeota archaeon]